MEEVGYGLLVPLEGRFQATTLASLRRVSVKLIRKIDFPLDKVYPCAA
jgi:hypothetical protein